MFGPHLLLAQATQPEGFLGVVDRLARTPLSQVVLFVAVCTVVRLALHPYLANVPVHRRSGAYSLAKILNELLDAIIYAGVFVFLIIRPFVLQTFYIPSGSMVQTLQINDYIIANKFIYRFSEPKAGDIAVFRPPTRALFPGQPMTDFIKRVVGVPGDVVEIRNHQLYRNGQPVQEPYKVFTAQSGQRTFRTLTPAELSLTVPPQDWKLVNDNGKLIPLTIEGDSVNFRTATAEEYTILDPDEGRRLRELPPAKIPPGFFLMMGDNRNGSFDSRGWGLVPRRDIIGRSEVIWMPVSRWRVTR